VDGKAAVTKSGVAVNVFAMFALQPAQRAVVKIKRKTFLQCTIQLYPKMGLCVHKKWRNKKAA
jgi:hypothetical protein